jgi:hypothetical protein
VDARVRAGQGDALYEFRDAMREHRWSDPYLAIATQPGRRSRYDLYDAAAFGHLHTLLMTGHAALAWIDVGAHPAADAAISENDEALGQLAPMWRAGFWGGKADCDGVLEWTRPFRIAAELADRSQLVIELPPGTAPLEVGSMEPETGAFHLACDGALARWP